MGRDALCLDRIECPRASRFRELLALRSCLLALYTLGSCPVFQASDATEVVRVTVMRRTITVFNGDGIALHEGVAFVLGTVAVKLVHADDLAHSSGFYGQSLSSF